MWEEKVGALLQRAAAWLHLTHTVTQNSLTCTCTHTHTYTQARQGDTPGFHSPATPTMGRSCIYTQTHTLKHDRHLDLVFVVSWTVSALKRGERRGGRGGAGGVVELAVKPIALSGCLRS